MKLGVVVSLALVLAACSSESPAPAQSDPADLTPAATESAAAVPAPPQREATAVRQIPPALQGRWGLVPADCNSTRGDAKGLLIVSAADLRFYESVGKLRSARSATETSLSGTFDYTGEGMNWTREVTLSARTGGNNLDFQDSGADAPASRRTYTRCN